MSLPRPEIVTRGGGRSPAFANLAKVDDRRWAFPSPRERSEWWGGGTSAGVSPKSGCAIRLRPNYGDGVDGATRGIDVP